MVDSTEELDLKAAEQKAKREEKRLKKKEQKKSPYSPNGMKKHAVMSRTEQTRKLHELKARFLNSKRLEPFVAKLFDIALDDEHQGQMAAMKLIADRILPTAGFSSEDKKSSAVQINITGLQVSSIEKEEKEVVSIQ
jgi:lysyl-tRNA synthetase class II